MMFGCSNKTTQGYERRSKPDYQAVTTEGVFVYAISVLISGGGFEIWVLTKGRNNLSKLQIPSFKYLDVIHCTLNMSIIDNRSQLTSGDYIYYNT